MRHSPTYRNTISQETALAGPLVPLVVTHLRPLVVAPPISRLALKVVPGGGNSASRGCNSSLFSTLF